MRSETSLLLKDLRQAVAIDSFEDYDVLVGVSRTSRANLEELHIISVRCIERDTNRIDSIFSEIPRKLESQVRATRDEVLCARHVL